MSWEDLLSPERIAVFPNLTGEELDERARTLAYIELQKRQQERRRARADVDRRIVMLIFDSWRVLGWRKLLI
jgi:hypothetical protein